MKQRATFSKIPVYQPDIGPAEQRNVQRCMESGWVSSRGEFVERFESEFAGFVGTQHAIGVCNGTVALHLALETLGIGPGDEVICPTLTYVASANAARYTGAEVKFVDCVSGTWNADIDSIEHAITPRTKAIIAVHLYGLPCNMPEICRLAAKHQIAVVEDCAEAVGGRIDGNHVGTFGDLATFSFYGNKTITTGEGGMVVSKQQALADRCRKLRGQGLAVGREYWHDELGYNYRMTNLAAAIGCGQMERIDQTLDRKRQVDARYREQLADIFDFQQVDEGYQHACWMTTILARAGQDRDALRSDLKRQGIETRPLFYPLHTMPIYQNENLIPITDAFPRSEAIARAGLTLPSHPGLSDRQIDHVCETVLAHHAIRQPIRKAV